MDDAHLDELERRGDSLLDEERHRRTYGISHGASWLSIAVRSAASSDVIQSFSLDYDDAAGFANAILAELEIIERGDTIK